VLKHIHVRRSPGGVRQHRYLTATGPADTVASRQRGAKRELCFPTVKS
jgi:hypothetical protein